jgi:hypothetical protein
MSPTWARKGSKRWRYYVSQAALQRDKGKAGSILRVPAAHVEALVAEAFGKLSPDRAASQTDIRDLIDRVVLGRATIRIQLSEVAEETDSARILTLPWTRPSPYRKREIIQGAGNAEMNVRPMCAHARDPDRSPPRRASLVGRASLRRPSDFRVNRFARGQERAFDQDDLVARFPRAGDRQGGS